MTKGEIIAAIIVAILGMIGTSIGSVFAYIQFAVKRKDEKEEKNVQKLIDEAIKAAKIEMMKELNRVSFERSEEGAQRFQKHKVSIDEINSQIKVNNEQISELTALVKLQTEKMEEQNKAQNAKLEMFAESMTSLNRVVKVSAESQRNANYDRILSIANRVLKNRSITITEKTNLKQLYESWADLHGDSTDYDPKIQTMYEECMKITPIPDGD